MNPRHLPNLLTAARIASVPPLVWLIDEGHYRGAVGLALAAGASDALDGWLAKRHGWQSRLGGLLDPIADKLLIAACFVGLWGVDALPTWLLLLILGRDLVIVAGAVAWQVAIGPVEAQPSRLSKATTAVQIVFALAALTLLGWFARPLPGWAVQASLLLTGLVATLTVASGLDYVVRWSRRAWRARHPGERPR